MRKKFIKTNNRNLIYNPEHSKANRDGYIYFSRYLMENKIGRCLEEGEVVHHINNNPLDDKIENLKIMSLGEHTVLHNSSRRKLDYNLIKTLGEIGLGYKRISRLTNYPKGSIEYALKVIRRPVALLL